MPFTASHVVEESPMSWPKVAWLPGAERVPLYFGGLGDYDGGKPKLLLHTTEGSSVSASEAAYRNGGFAPHLTIGPDPAHPGEFIIDQHYPFTSRSTTLEDPAGGCRTNRMMVIQIEITGFCDPRWSNSPLYIGNWSDEYWAFIADVCAKVCKLADIPVESKVSWDAYPGSYGLAAKQRLSESAYIDYTGILGHQHAVENHHGDPGAFDIDKLLSLMAAKPQPEPTPDPAPTIPLEDEVIHAPWLASRHVQKLPAKKYQVLRLGLNAKSKKAIVSALWGAMAADKFWVDTWVQLRGLKPGQQAVGRFYAVDNTHPGKRLAQWPPQEVTGNKGDIRLHFSLAAGQLPKSARLRFELTVPHSKCSVIRTDTSVNYTQRKAA